MARLNELMLCSALVLAAGAAMANDFVGQSRGLAYRLVPQTEMHYRSVVMQQADWSCASASMATLLWEKFEEDVPENALFGLIVMTLADDAVAMKRLEERGMSASHLMQMAKAAGYQGQGVRRSLAGLLEKESLPVIAHITEPHPDQPDRNFEHWVVVSGIAGERVMVRDPVRGNRRMPLYAFRTAWIDKDGKGFLFRVERDITAVASVALLANVAAPSPQPEDGSHE